MNLEELHLWLAERLPELRLQCFAQPPSKRHPQCCRADDSRTECGWVPNVTTDALLEALRRCGFTEVRVRFLTHGRCGVHLSRSPHEDEEAIPFYTGVGVYDVSPHEALCRAAKKALDASS